MKGLSFIIKVAFILFLTIRFNYSLAQMPGQIDTTFALPRLIVGDSTRFTGGNVNAMVIQPDNKIILGGSIQYYNGVVHNGIVRITPDGNYDSLGFFPGNGFTNGYIFSLVLLPNGKILVGGNFTDFNGQFHSGLVRLNSDGTIDTLFHDGAGVQTNYSIYTLAIQDDGKILAGGNFTLYNNIPCERIIRLNENGDIDTSFHPGTGFNNTVFSVSLDSANNIYVGGSFDEFNGNSVKRIVKLDTSGAVDTTFKIGTGFDDNVSKIKQTPDGNLLIAGLFTTFNDTAVNKLIRITPSGSLDTTLNTGSGFDGVINDLILDSLDNILIVGDFYHYNGISQDRITRITSTGLINTRPFHIINHVLHGPKTLAIESDGNILVAGEMDFNNTSRFGIFRLDNNFYLNNTFNVFSGIRDGVAPQQSNVHAITVQNDGKILVGGDYERYNGKLCISLIRLLHSGEIDTSFQTGLLNAGSEIWTIKIDSVNLKIYIGGIFDMYDSIPRKNLARLNWDGTLDSTFVIGGGFNGRVKDIVVQPDGKVVVAGNFSTLDGATCVLIARLETNGSVDTTFTSRIFTFMIPNAILLQPDGKILIGGDFDFYDGHSVSRIVRVNADGSYDSTFSIGGALGVSSFNIVKDMVLQPDGKIIAVGDLVRYFTIPTYDILRLEANGALDTTFSTTGFGVNYADLFKVGLQSDGKIIVGGDFRYFAQDTVYHFLRLNSDGTIDHSFHTGKLFNSEITALAVQPDNNILVGGNYTKYEPYFINRLARIYGDTASTSTFINESSNEPIWNVYPNPTTGHLIIETPEMKEYFQMEIINLQGQVVQRRKLFNKVNELFVQELPGVYFVRLYNEHLVSIQKLILN